MDKDQAEQLVSKLNIEYVCESVDNGFKFTLRLSKEPERLCMITLTDSYKPECDCIFTYFFNKNLLVANTGVFVEVIDGLKSFLNTELFK